MRSEKRKGNQTERTIFKVGGFVFCAIIAIWLINYFALKDLKHDERGTFGDMFGSVNALFSGFAFAGIIITILLQRNELKLQRKELKQTRTEFKIQNNTLKRQRLENTFFHLLTQHNNIISGLFFIESQRRPGENKADPFKDAKRILDGVALNVLREKIQNKIYGPGTQIAGLTYGQTESFIQDVADEWYISNPHNFHLYFQSLKRILKFIHRTELLDSDNDRLFYASLLRDQMSIYESAVVLYACLRADPSLKGITYYLKRYQILDNINPDDLVTSYDKFIFDKWVYQNEPLD